ncbi:hypothetical protein CH373_14140 [Leptospira perolatii]|uniref:NAD glycohydrolase translocation F5/8 type C domain-containing protein n=1 Tax=Leptospira perolatii TaxID=2023191 RepID=A0A2M9ZKP6_9LEPT|nr:hypothetical protein [Leptospira perolatii]PJZ69409.1 hypothetical protein CH360_11705 [Leptospira perolatii]PJZ72544.1 hypothetical protein CH373_14140 [Leptospira perolatii]
MRKILLFIFIFLYYSNQVFGQMYEGSPCTSKHNQVLKNQILGGQIQRLYGDGAGHIFPSSYYLSKDWATSILLPTSGIPKVPKVMNEDNMDLFVERDAATCRYSPFHLRDGDTSTAWSEGVEGDGIGEFVLARIDVQTPIQIFSGYGKSKELYFANNRPKEINIYIFEAGEYGAAQIGSVYENLQLRGKSKQTLKDTYGYQELKLPKVPLKGTAQPGVAETEKAFYTFVAIEIVSVYKGSKYSDTLITEIKNQSN